MWSRTPGLCPTRTTLAQSNSKRHPTSRSISFSHTMDDNQTQPIRTHTRRRRTLVCEPCRQSKLRCDRNHPCSNCLRSKNKSCSYLRPPAQQQSGLAETPPRRAPRSISRAQPHQSDRVRRPVAQAPVPFSLAAATADAADAAESRDIGEPGGRSSATQGTWHSSSALGSVFIGGPSDIDTGVSTRSGDGSGPQKPTGGNAEDQEPPLGELIAANGLKEYVISMQRSPHPIKCVMVKDRCVGQTHWLHSAVLVSIATSTQLRRLCARGSEIIIWC